MEGYGLTECSPIIVGNPMSTDRRPGYVGIPFPDTQVRIANPDNLDETQPDGVEGEVLARGPQIFKGYLNNDEATEAAFHGEWFRTGDMGVMEEDGFIRLVSRIKEIIITGGFNVYPGEVEEILREHPSIDDVAVVGRPREDGSEDVVACLDLADGAALDPEGLKDYCRERLTRYKVPAPSTTLRSWRRTRWARSAAARSRQTSSAASRPNRTEMFRLIDSPSDPCACRRARGAFPCRIHRSQHPAERDGRCGRRDVGKRSADVLDTAQAQLTEYFAGQRRTFELPSIRLRRPTSAPRCTRSWRKLATGRRSPTATSLSYSAAPARRGPWAVRAAPIPAHRAAVPSCAAQRWRARRLRGWSGSQTFLLTLEETRGLLRVWDMLSPQK